MKHAGKAQAAAWRLIFLSLGAVLVLLVVGLLAKLVGSFVLGLASLLVTLWILFTVFTLYFFRDPEPQAPTDQAPPAKSHPAAAHAMCNMYLQAVARRKHATRKKSAVCPDRVRSPGTVQYF